MKTTKVEIIKVNEAYYVRKTITTTLWNFKISKDVSYLDDGEVVAFEDKWWPSSMMRQGKFSSAEEAENAYKGYYQRNPLPSPSSSESVKVLDNYDA